MSLNIYVINGNNLGRRALRNMGCIFSNPIAFDLTFKKDSRTSKSLTHEKLKLLSQSLRLRTITLYVKI